MRRRWLATTVLLLLPAAAKGEQVNYGVRTSAIWSDNVFGASEQDQVFDPQTGQFFDVEKVDDYSLRISPWAELEDPDGDLNWSLRYQPSYEYYLDNSGLNGFDHEVGGAVAWQVTDRTTLRVSDTFQDYRSVARFNELVDQGQTTVLTFQEERQDVKANRFDAGLRHRLTPRDALVLSFAHSLRDPEEGTGRDLTAINSALSYRHTLTERTTLGSALSWTRQNFEQLGADDQVTDYYNLAGIFEHSFSRTLRAEISAGPTLIQGDPSIDVADTGRFLPVPARTAQGQGGGVVLLDANTCPEVMSGPDTFRVVDQRFQAECGELGPLTVGEIVNLLQQPLTPVPRVGLIPSVDESSITYFARVALLKDWERWHLELLYERRDSETTGLGGSGISDTVGGSLRWDVAPRWSAQLRATWSLIEQASDSLQTVLVVENRPIPGVTSVPEAATVTGFLPVTVDQAFEQETIFLAPSLSYQLTRQSTAFVAVYWYEQTVEGGSDLIGGGSDFERDKDQLSVWIGFSWRFDPFKF